MTAFDAIPAELRERPQWVVWSAETRDGKTTKVPYRADLRGRASSTDPATWSTFDAALVATKAADGIGYVFSADDGYVGVDLDDGLSEADRGAIIGRLDSYTETSVSGTGFHVILRASLNGHRRNRSGPFEVYEHGRYFCMTGDHILGRRRRSRSGRPNSTRCSPTSCRPRTKVQIPQRAGIRASPSTSTTASSSTAPWPPATAPTSPASGTATPPATRRHSEADLALCNMLAFWTGRDAGRIDRLFRSSGLMREKWERDDYRSRTIATAISATKDVYKPASENVRPSGDAPGTHLGFASEADVELEGASLRPHRKGDAVGDAPSSAASDEPREPLLTAEEAAAFAAVEEESAKPLLGDKDNTILAAGGSACWYGDGGAGKTTLGLDRAFHLCAGLDWLSLPVPKPVKVLWIENEGPRGKFREKVRRKLETWDGPPLEDRLHVLVTPWAQFTFANERMREELVELVRTLGSEVIIAGPVSRLGAEGGGTPKEIQDFVNLLELVRADLDRPLAYELIHHENKSGNVSGAWEGATDTLVHVQARGNGHTAIVWSKARWAHDLHGRTWKLNWLDGEGYEVDDTPETTDDEIAAKLLELVAVEPGGSWNAYDDLLTGKAKKKRLVRDRLLEEEQLVNDGTAKAMRLFLPGQVEAPLQAALDEEAGDA